MKCSAILISRQRGTSKSSLGIAKLKVNMNWLYCLTDANAMTLSFAVLIIAYIFIASGKVSKVTVALLGACAVIIWGLVSTNKLLPTGKPNPDYYVNFIDFNVIFLLIGMMLIVSITAKSGIFDLAAKKMVSLARGHPMGILFALGIFTGVVSAFLDNVTTVILVLPITFSICSKLQISPLPYLLTEIFASNIGGTATLIGDPPNIIIGSAGNLSFTDFLRVSAPVVVIILLVVIGAMCIVFRRDLRASESLMAQFAEFKSERIRLHKRSAIRSLSILFLVILGFMLHGITGIPASVTALAGASVLMLSEKPESLFKDVEWNSIFFFIGLFVIIGALEASGAIKLMANAMIEFTGGSQCATSMIILWGSGLISGVIDNIPYTATLAPMILEIEKNFGRDYADPLWWSLSLGACLGGNMTIIGAAANVIVSETAAKRGLNISFMKFLAYGSLITFISLAISTVYIILRYFI